MIVPGVTGNHPVDGRSLPHIPESEVLELPRIGARPSQPGEHEVRQFLTATLRSIYPSCLMPVRFDLNDCGFDASGREHAQADRRLVCGARSTLSSPICLGTGFTGQVERVEERELARPSLLITNVWGCSSDLMLLRMAIGSRWTGCTITSKPIQAFGSWKGQRIWQLTPLLS